MQRLALLVQEGLKRNPHGGDLVVFRARRLVDQDHLARRDRHVALAMRLEKGRFVWPSAKDGTVSLSPSQLICLLEGIDWRNPLVYMAAAKRRIISAKRCFALPQRVASKAQ